MKNKLFTPELLAPAGNLETAVAAFSAGADAVYLGLGKFNARNRAENFTPENLARLLEYAHNHNRKVYVTLNTLITEKELPELMSTLSALAKLPLDAVIVQDLGTLYMVRKYFPEITVHASTQMNIHNSCGIKALELLGVKRVILERQITLEELKSIAQTTSMELEVFVHGSLCISLSGRCLLSSCMENASGNRGMCRQLCRRNYRGENTQSPPLAHLSPRDLQIMQELPELAKLKVASLKIEGRLRGPDYVVPVVKAYRYALDNLNENITEGIKMINRTISRPTSSGALYGFKKMIAPELQAVFGRNAGMIKSAGRNGFTVLLNDRIHLGDKLRIVNTNNASIAGFELTEIIYKDSKVSSANAGSTVFIPGKFPFMEGVNYLYKIGENGYDFKRQAAALPEPRTGIKLALLLDEDGLHVTAPELEEFEFHSESFAPARNCKVSAEDLQSVFSAGDDEYRGSIVSLEIKGDWFCAKSVLKDLRRELFTALRYHVQKNNRRQNRSSRAMMRFYHDYQNIAPATANITSETIGMTIPGFVAEGDLEAYRKKIRAAAERGVKHFGIGGLHGAILIKEALGSLKNIKISAMLPLIVCNSQAAELLKRFHISAVTPWVELPQQDLEDFKLKSLLPLLEVPEEYELLVTRAPLKVKKLIDKNGNVFKTVFDPEEKVTKIYLSEPVRNRFRKQEKF